MARHEKEQTGMVREPDELMEMRRVLGTQLATYRQAAGLTQGQLAKTTFRDRSTVAHIETGRSRADKRFWTLADECCGAEGALRAGFHSWQTAKQDREVQTREAQLAQARAKAESLRAAAAPMLAPDADVPDGADDEANQVVEQLVRLLCGLVGGMNRRKLLQLLGWTTGTGVISSAVSNLDTDEQERLVRAIVSPSRVDHQVIDHTEAIFRYCKRQEDALGSRAVLDTVLAQRNLVDRLLMDCPDRLRPRLLSVYSNMSSSVGFYFFDHNDFVGALGYHEEARAAAHEARNIGLGVYALCEMSYTACCQDKSHTAIDFAAAAHSLAKKTEDPLLGVCVADKAARAYAIDSQYKTCMVELERANDGLASAGDSSAESPAYWYHQGLLASGKSECLLRLGKPQEAAVSASEGLALFDRSFVDGYAVCTLRLGNAHLQSGEIDEAARVVGDAAGLAVQTRSARLVKELRTTRARMEPWQGTQAVSVLDNQLAACGLRSTTVD